MLNPNQAPDQFQDLDRLIYDGLFPVHLANIDPEADTLDIEGAAEQAFTVFEAASAKAAELAAAGLDITPTDLENRFLVVGAICAREVYAEILTVRDFITPDDFMRRPRLHV
ncbi:MAG: hypothetical protein AAB971_00615 [Patescibacteria group bacterium]